MKKLYFLIIIFISYSAIGQNTSKKNSTDSLLNLYLSQVNYDSVNSYITHLQNFGTRNAKCDSTKKLVADWIRNKFISFGYTNVFLDSFDCVFPGHDTSLQYNVICSQIGQINPEKILIMGAHHDSRAISSYDCATTAPGADDNASGVAGVLESARIIKKNNYQNPLTIKFITFAAEEYGYKGSLNYASKAFNASMNIQMMINFDVICASPPDSINFRVVEGSYQNGLWLIKLADSIRVNYTNLLPKYQGGYYTDSDMFDDKGFPAILLEEYPLSNNIHTVNDLLLNCDLNYCTQIIRIGLGMLIKSADTLTNINDYEIYGIIISIFPNPVTSILSIELANPSKTAYLSVYNILGKEIISKTFTGDKTQIDVSGLAKGLYLLKVQEDEVGKLRPAAVVVRRFVKE